MSPNIPSIQVDDPMIAVPIPKQVSAKEGMAELPDTHLGYWDTGDSGEPVPFLHPASGSALIWLYQQPVFAKTGYRVIAYSRRSYYNSDSTPENNPDGFGRSAESDQISRAGEVPYSEFGRWRQHRR